MDTNQFRLSETDYGKLFSDGILRTKRGEFIQIETAILSKVSPVLEQMQAEIERLKGLLGPTYYMRIKRNEKEIGITGTDFAECESKRRKFYPDWTVVSPNPEKKG